jgi:signal transduction histidine kinase
VHTTVHSSSGAVFATELEVATATHDLRNQLSVVRLEVKELHRALSSTNGACDRELSDSLTFLESSLAQTSALLESVLDNARRCAHLQPGVQSRRVDLVAISRRLIATGYHGRDQQRLKLDARCSRLIGTWHVERIRHLLRVLITNALQYSSAECEVTVRIDHADNDALLRVTDCGIGIPAADLPRVCDPFFRCRFIESVVPGLGLGLTTARLIVDHYAGSLDVQSVEGAGTSVVVRLPLESF